ncbi:MAG: manganese efflux pump MntP family protein [Gallionella sp.]|jgi:putative Mn2+ efflux pump MntP
MLEVIILAIALSMDAFAVSIGLGAKKTNNAHLGLLAGVYFGAFQALMPFIGYLGGRGILGWIEAYAHWIALILLTLIGTKMIYESWRDELDPDFVDFSHKMMLILSIATSIDAMAAGFSLTLIDFNAYIACLIIGATTFAFSWAGVRIGEKSGTYLENKAEFFGGTVLILIGIKIFLSY